MVIKESHKTRSLNPSRTDGAHLLERQCFFLEDQIMSWSRRSWSVGPTEQRKLEDVNHERSLR